MKPRTSRASGASSTSDDGPDAGRDASRPAATHRIAVQLAGADPHNPVQVPDEDLAVADFAGAGGLHDRLYHAIDLVVGDGDFQLDLGQEVDHVLGPAVQLGVALLATEALDLGGGDARHAGLGQRLADIVELERLDHGHDHLHRLSPGVCALCRVAAARRE
jgi:hypothetical protein